MDCDHLIDEIQTLRRERDEARQEVDRLLGRLDEATNAAIVAQTKNRKLLARLDEMLTEDEGVTPGDAMNHKSKGGLYEKRRGV